MLKELWYKYSPQLYISELLEKRWVEPIVPFMLMCVVIATIMLAIPTYQSVIQVQQLARGFGEQGIVAMAMAVSILSGGIDLSLGAVFAMSNLIALYVVQVLELPFAVGAVAVLAWGVAVGAFNGLMIAYLGTRPLLTTMVMLIIIQASYNKLSSAAASRLSTAYAESPTWDFVGAGSLVGIPINVLVLLVIAVATHIYLTRMRPGLHTIAVGANRKAARHAGIDVKRSLFSAYVYSSSLAAIAGLLYAARQNSAGPDTGLGWEITALVAVALGGISLSGGRGTISRAVMGAVIIYLLTNGLVQLGAHGSLTSSIIGFILLLAVGLNIKFVQNKGRILQKIYVSPTILKFKKPPTIARNSGTVFAENDRLKDIEALALGEIEGPEDIVFDREDNLYTVNRTGAMVRFFAPDYKRQEIFAQIGGRPLGMAIDPKGNIVICVAFMGVYSVSPEGKITKLADRTKRTFLRPKDDSIIRFADDLDIGPDGKIYFSDATSRHDDWALDGVEARGNGRMVCHDPATGKTDTIVPKMPFPNGVCVSHDGRSVLFVSTWQCRVYRYWTAGEKRGSLEILIDNLPGYPDNINRASDGRYWLALAGIRAPVYDLSMANPGVRIRMVKQIPPDEWLCPGLNYGCIVKFDDRGTVHESLWDPGGKNHPTITSMREHKGFLYIGGLENNRIGRLRLADADPTWTGWDSYWGHRRRDGYKPLGV